MAVVVVEEDLQTEIKLNTASAQCAGVIAVDNPAW
jgi:hypothetical protein